MPPCRCNDGARTVERAPPDRRTGVAVDARATQVPAENWSLHGAAAVGGDAGRQAFRFRCLLPSYNPQA